jgi:ribosomal protein S18 acetylase RimI-like enzyme
MSNFTIRPLQTADFPDWLPLWDANNQGKRDEAVTAETWSRLIDPASPVNGLCAVRKGKIVGLVHYILHLTTGSIAPICYMQDVYVDPAHRQKGIARDLVLSVYNIGQQQQWGRMYWLAEARNDAAQALYKNLGVKLDFTLHVLPLSRLSS